MDNKCWVDAPGRLKEEVCMFFMKRFEENEWVRPKLDGVKFQNIGQQHNDILTECFHEEEIKAIVWDCGSEKNPGPNELNFKFIKESWHVIKPDVAQFLEEFFVNGVFPKGSNASFIALIPKVLDPQNLSEYRPISLIGYMYKIMAKILARRLKKVLATIIDERQTAFIRVDTCCMVCLSQMK